MSGCCQDKDVVYNIAVKKICSMMGTRGSTTNVSLDKLGKYLFNKKWSGVYASDQFPKFDDDKIYAIMNLDESWMAGSHWIALIKHKESNLLAYDSFGRSINELIPDLKKKFEQSGGKKVLNTEDDAEQNVQESSCGQRSMAAIFVYDQFGYEQFMQL